MSCELPQDSVAVTAIGPVNIAVIKYWGKRDKSLILPTNSSFSATLHMDALKSQTTVIASKEFSEDSMQLNDKSVNVSANKRLVTVINTVRAKAQDFCDEDGKVLIPASAWPEYKLRIVSHNNFPTAAGLASSASGYACLARALTSLFGVDAVVSPSELSVFARIGSGSASRSMFGGWVEWQKGKLTDGTDSVAVQHFDEEHWPEMRVLVLVVNAGAKETPSTSGMQTTVDTSEFLAHRVDAELAEKRLATLAQAVHLAHRINNNDAGETKVAYTYDAGPNAVFYLREQHVNEVLRAVTEDFGLDLDRLVYDPMALLDKQALGLTQVDAKEPVQDSPIKRIIVTKVGPGAQVTRRTHSFQ
ncbi:MAG: hypothetical protein MHM6MM_001642 [Cercozoa sp. M6MM]